MSSAARTSSAPRPRATTRSARLVTIFVATVALTAAILVSTGPASADGGRHGRPPTARAEVVSEWSAITQRTVFTEAATPVPASTLYFGFVSAAVYNAVVTIEGRYEQYTYQRPPRGRASSEAAVAAAAHGVLRHYFPASADALDADLTASLERVPDGRKQDTGVAVGQAAADAVIALREDDGLGAAVTFDQPAAPGVWRPTPDAHAAFAVPWLGFVEPMLLPSPTHVALPGPDPITSRRYARELREVQRYGSVDSTRRSADQTETALFFSDNAVAQYQSALRDQAMRRDLDIVESARMFAIIGVTTADTLIACWRAKYDDGYWRPVTAIREADTDSNRWTDADPTWTPLAQAPPYPEYTSGHACVTGAMSNGLSHLFGARRIDVHVDSAGTGTSRVYRTARSLDRDTMDARIWLGLHFRKAMTDGNRLGHEVSDYGIRHAFQPID